MLRHVVRGSLIAAALALSPPIVGAGETVKPEPTQERFLSMPQLSVAVQTPELVCGPVVLSYAVSPDGRYVLAGRERFRVTEAMLRKGPAADPPPPPAFELVLWDSVTGVSREVWRAAGSSTYVRELHWLPQVKAWLALLQMLGGTQERSTRDYSLIRVDAETGRPTEVGAWCVDEGTYMGLAAPPKQSMLLLCTTPFGPADSGQPSVQVIPGSGDLGTLAQASEAAVGLHRAFDERGEPVVEAHFPVGGRANEITARWYSLNPRTGALTEPPKAPTLHTSRTSPRPPRAIA